MERHILVLEDEEEISTLITIILSHAGFQVSCFPTLRQATNALQNQTFSLALIDANMPDGTSFDLIKMLKKTSCEVILMSGNLESFHSLNFQEYLTLEKPFRIQNLLSVIEQAEKKRPTSSPLSP
ncbi:response regulator [Entomobacter blattae]|uniref:Response regulator receiver domain protein n=1 Tax=Entomobacter blattae TaxID=2762277 RepID=A0A7H1NNL3_9PROT|nr:response regulator [Entomobacter blattae]QNT77373.1 Response regulator receiver domain protein [Entomobacter blattae]